MKAFVKGFIKGLVGCVIGLAFVLAFCHFAGVFQWVDGGNIKQTVKEQTELNAESDTSSSERVEEAEELEHDVLSEDKKESEGELPAMEPEAETAEPVEKPVRMLFAGDVYLPEGMQGNYDREGIHAIVTPELQDTLTGADIFVINQEFPFGTTGEPMEDKQYTFRIHPRFVSVEQELGVDLVTLANNHVLDFGRSPLTENFTTLDQAGIAYVGAGADLAEAKALKTFQIEGKTIGFLGASRVIPVGSWNAGKNLSGVFTTYDPTQLVEEIKKAREVCDFVVVYVHWGIERNTTPEDYQRNLGQAYIDAGADAVIGSHPHVVQGIEYYKGKPIVYSLGNFIFNVRTYDTMLAELTLEDGASTLRLIPCISEAGRVRLMEEKDAFYQMMEGLSFGVSFNEEGVANAAVPE